MDLGYQVEVAREGEEALKRIGEKDFDVLILDLRLPGKDGLQVLKEAKARKPKLHGIIITAYPSVEKAVEAMKGGGRFPAQTSRGSCRNLPLRESGEDRPCTGRLLFAAD